MIKHLALPPTAFQFECLDVYFNFPVTAIILLVMANNIEIKAKVSDISEISARASKISQSSGVVITQRDTFFNCTTGRLKLRELADGTGQLISYQRSDTLEPTQSDYLIFTTESPDTLRDTLSMTLGIRGEVKKSRRLYLSGRTRIHIDDVENLGHFMELEVVLASGENEETGTKEAQQLMDQLGITKDDLIRVAYIDMILG